MRSIFSKVSWIAGRPEGAGLAGTLQMVRFVGMRAPFVLFRRGVEIALGLVVFSALARFLSREEFATYSLALSLTAAFRFTSLPGVGNALGQAFARSRFGGFVKGNMVALGSSLTGSMLLAGVGWWHSSNDPFAASAIYAAAIGFPLYSIQFWRNTAVGTDRYGLLISGDLSVVCLRAALVLALAISSQSVALIVAAYLLSHGLVNVIATINEARRPRFNHDTEPNMLKYGIRISFFEAANGITTQLDQLALYFLVSPSALATYAVSMRVPLLMTTAFGEAMATLDPMLARASRFDGDIRRFTLLAGLGFITIAVLTSFFLVPFALPILAGKEYQDAVIYAQILTIGIGFGTLGRTIVRYIKSQMDSAMFLRIALVWAATDAIVLVGGIALFGLMGATVAFVAKSVINSLTASYLIRRRQRP